MLNKILTVSTLALCLSAFSARAQINQDVYIDYSVLDDLADTANPKVHNQPLFPEVKKTAAPAAKKAVTAKPVKPAAKKAAVAAPAVKVEKETVKIEVIEKKVETPAVKPAAEPVVEPVRSLEPETMTVKPLAPVEAPVPAPTAEKAAPVVETPAIAERPVSAPAMEKPLETAVPAEEKTVQKDLPAPDASDRKIFFADDEAALSEANKQKIDLILQSFGALPDGKIAINSYNYDDGNDVFKKKRQSLDRAIAVRSYLLSKNYKNFSIKVVNVTDDDSKKNLVEIEEIK